MPTTPYASSRLAQFIDKRIEEIADKSQVDIAREAGFSNANYLSMLKSGNSKLALDRVVKLAKALETDPSYLMKLALEQAFGTEMMITLSILLAADITSNERLWVDLIREHSGKTDPSPTEEEKNKIRRIFRSGKRI